MNASTLTKSLEFLLDELPEIAPLDEYHRALVSHVHPMNWQNPEPPPRHNLVVIGAGTAGLGARAKRFRSMGADVFLGEARFTGPEIIEVDGRTLRCKQAVIATGARAVAPPTFLPA